LTPPRTFPPIAARAHGHSAGGTFTFAYLDGVEKIPDDVERIAFLDSDYAYDATKGHDAKLLRWLGAPTRIVSVSSLIRTTSRCSTARHSSAKPRHVGRSQALLHDLAQKFSFARTDAAGLQTHVALDGRVKFFLRENPTSHPPHAPVEWNGFIHANGFRHARENAGYTYLGPRAYADWIARE